jgi:hypothetical protein
MDDRQTRPGEPRTPWRYGQGPREPREDPLGGERSREPREDHLEGERYEREQAPPPPRGRGLDFTALFVVIDVIRRAAPRELEQQFTALIREALLTMRSLIDWYLERLDGREREPRVEDIPID